MLRFVNQGVNASAEFLMGFWTDKSGWPGLIFASLLSAGLLVLLFQMSSNQPALLRRRNRFVARAIELQLFRHDLSVSFAASGRILAANFLYLKQFVRPLLVALIPMFLVFTQLAHWFEFRPLQRGETAVLEVELDQSYSVLRHPVTAIASPNARLDSPGVRLPTRNELAWRLRAVEAGSGWIEVHIGAVTERKALTVDNRLVRVSTHRVRPGFWPELLHPVEPTLSATGPITNMHLQYPRRELLLGDREIPWSAAAVVLIMLFGLIIGKLFGIRIA